VADEDDALHNGLGMSRLRFKTTKADWAHLIRNAMEQAKQKLNNPSEARLRELYEDLCFIHENVDPALRPHQLLLTESKWRAGTARALTLST
jgi:hypothetical protein